MVDVLHLVAVIANEQKEAVTADVQKAEWVASCASIFLVSDGSLYCQKIVLI